MIIPRATPEQIQAVFNLIDPDRLDKSDTTMLTIAVNGSALFASDYQGDGGLVGYRDHEWKNRAVPRADGPAANVVKSLLDYNYLNLDKRPTVKVSIYTPAGDATLPRLHTSLLHNGFENDIENDHLNFHQISEGDDEEDYERNLAALAEAIHESDVDFAITSKLALAERLNLLGTGACVLLDPGFVPPYDPLDTRWYATDGDGALWSDHFEKEFQRIHGEAGGDLVLAKRRYYDYVVENAGSPMAVGPAYRFFHKLTKMKQALRRNPNLKDFLKTKLVTTRDLRGALPFQAFAEAFDLHFNRRHYVTGSLKNRWLKGAILFSEDDTTHLERTLKMPDNQRPKTHAYLPYGVKHEMRKKGQKVISEAQHVAPKSE